MSYWFGTVRGAERTLDQFRDLSFQNTEASMGRLLRFDAMLAAGDVDGARRGIGQVAWSHYTTLEDDAAGATLPASAKMRASIAGIREVVSGYCAAGYAAPLGARAAATGPAAAGGGNAAAGPTVCSELAQRGK